MFQLITYVGQDAKHFIGAMVAIIIMAVLAIMIIEQIGLAVARTRK